jgi:hypothetical protein
MNASLRRLALVIAVVSVALFFHAPRLWLMLEPMPGTFQWDRALQFQVQAIDPLASGVEPALRWRLLPAFTAHVLGMEKAAIFIFPALGVVAFLFYTFTRLEQLGFDRRSALAVLTLLASSSAVLVPLHWWGMNDAWAWLALAVVVLDPSRTTWAIACFLGPWIDERFLIALPLACLSRWIIHRSLSLKDGMALIPGVIIYLAVRLWAWRTGAAHDPSESFVISHLQMMKDWIPYAPLGWWMAWRLAWILPLFVLAYLWSVNRTQALLWGCVLLATALVMIPLAADLSRSAALVLTAILCGCVLLHRHRPGLSLPVLGALAVLNLFIPTAHVVYNKIDIISPLPVELVRWWRTPSPQAIPHSQ